MPEAIWKTATKIAKIKINNINRWIKSNLLSLSI